MRSPHDALRVLLIEDNPADVELAVVLLRGFAGCEIELTCASRLEDAIDEIRSAVFDAVIADLSLPDSTPAETLRHIRQTGASVAVVVLSGTEDDELRREALSSGAQEFLVKGSPATLALGRSLLDAVERHRAQGTQRQVERLISLVPDAVIVATEDGQVRFVNQAAEQLFDRTESEFFAEKVDFALAEGANVLLEILRGEERRIGEMRVVAVDWQGLPARLATIRDHTDRRHAEAAVATVDRLVSIGAMAASVAHEVNNPLAAVIVNLELAALKVRELPGLEELCQLIADTREAAEHMRNVAGDLRILSRATEERTELVDLQQVIKSALRLAGHETRQRAEVFVTCDEDLPLIQGQASRLVQLLLNLVVNAAQSMRDDSTRQRRIDITVRKGEAAWLELAVSDTGSGMSEQVLERLFSPFFTTKPAGQGTGLGLSICRRIVDSCGGSISVESQLGQGTTFTVRLPSGSRPLPAHGLSSESTRRLS